MALLGPRPQTSELVLKDSVFETEGALARMQLPAGWSGSVVSLFKGSSCELHFRFGDSGGDPPYIGIFVELEANESRLQMHRDRSVFNRELNLIAGSAEAMEATFKGGASALQWALWSVGSRHAETCCTSLRTTDFKGLRAAFVESEDYGFKFLECCVDASGDGSLIFVVYYQQTPEKYQDDLALAYQIFESTVWRRDFEYDALIKAIPPC